MNSQKINDWTTYILVALLWSPHATKECVELCTGPVFISPALLAFFTPFVQMDISIHGFLMQLVWAPLFIASMYYIFHLRDKSKFNIFFKLYIIRWILFFIVMIVFYNVLFWGGLRQFIFPSFIF